MESYRTAQGPRQLVVGYWGDGRAGPLGCVALREAADSKQARLFPSAEPKWVEVDLKRVRVEPDAAGYARLAWIRADAWREWAQLSEGCYVLRSNVTDWTPEELWQAYVQ